LEFDKPAADNEHPNQTPDPSTTHLPNQGFPHTIVLGPASSDQNAGFAGLVRHRH